MTRGGREEWVWNSGFDGCLLALVCLGVTISRQGSNRTVTGAGPLRAQPQRYQSLATVGESQVESRRKLGASRYLSTNSLRIGCARGTGLTAPTRPEVS